MLLIAGSVSMQARIRRFDDAAGVRHPSMKGMLLNSMAPATRHNSCGRADNELLLCVCCN